MRAALLRSTQWIKFHLAADAQKLSTTAPQRSTKEAFDAKGDGVIFLTEPMNKTTEITGRVTVKLHISSPTADADLFLVLRVFTPDLKEFVFKGALDPHTAIGPGVVCTEYSIQHGRREQTG